MVRSTVGRLPGSGRWRVVVGVVAVLVVPAGLVVDTALTSVAASAGCQVSYTVTSSWAGGFTGDVSVTDLGSAVSSWTLTWSFGAGQAVTQAWNAAVTQSGSVVTAANVSYNGAIATGGSVDFGFNGSWGSSNPVPSGFALNGVTCTGASSTPPATSAPPTSPPPTSASASAAPTSSSSSGTPTVASDGTGKFKTVQAAVDGPERLPHGRVVVFHVAHRGGAERYQQAGACVLLQQARLRHECDVGKIVGSSARGELVGDPVTGRHVIDHHAGFGLERVHHRAKTLCFRSGPHRKDAKAGAAQPRRRTRRARAGRREEREHQQRGPDGAA